jgi:hypothetical protein
MNGHEGIKVVETAEKRKLVVLQLVTGRAVQYLRIRNEKGTAATYFGAHGVDAQVIPRALQIAPSADIALCLRFKRIHGPETDRGFAHVICGVRRINLLSFMV